MASITDCVVEGLKYPFNNVKKLLGFGALFAAINLISIAATNKSIDIARYINGHEVTSLHSMQLPSGDIAIIAILTIISFIISLFIMGYQYNIIKFSIEKKEDLPGFGDVSNIFVNGIKYFIVVLAYNIIPIIFTVLGIVFMSDSTTLLLVVFLISMLLFIIAYFLLVMALNNMVAHDSIKKAFDFKDIIDKIANLGWVKYIGTILFTIIVYAIIMAAVGFILSFVTLIFAMAVNQAIIVSAFVSIIEGLLITSYGAVFYHRVCGSIYREAIK